MRWACVLIVAGGCGRVGFDALPADDATLVTDQRADSLHFDGNGSGGLQTYESTRAAVSHSRGFHVTGVAPTRSNASFGSSE